MQGIQPVQLSDFLGKINILLTETINFLSGVAPGFFLLIFILGLIISGIGFLFGLKGMKGAGISTVFLSLAGYMLVVFAPLILGVIKGLAE